MENESPQMPDIDELLKCYKGIEFPSGDIDDLIFCKIEPKISER